jgi:transposase-like protein
MICPNCQSGDVVVRDSRVVSGERQRRRKCRACNARWFTAETLVSGSLDVPKAEPEWWSRARSLRRKRLGPLAIARELGKSHSTVIHALKPTERQNKRRREAEYIAGAEGREVFRVKKAVQRAKAREAQA